jgi:hypothetical protein
MLARVVEGGVIAAPPYGADRDRHAYSAVVLSSESDIDRLRDSAPQFLWARDTTRPRFFLASLATGQWAPCVVVVSRGRAVVGIVYAKQRRIAGLSTGLVFADGSLGHMVVADPLEQEDILAVALQKLFASSGVRGVRLVIPPNGPEQQAITTVQAAMALDVSYTHVDHHSRLLLPHSYQEFLQGLGCQTRRNFRRYRCHFEAAGHRYIEQLSADDFRHVAWYLQTKSRIPSSRRAIERSVNMMAAVDRPMAIGLRHRRGEWLSVAAGWYDSSRVTLFAQLNHDRAFADMSLSVVLRVNLIDMLIRQGIRELVFWAGTAPPLSRYAAWVPAMGVHLDRPTRGWRTGRTLIARLGAWMPRRIAAEMRWMAASGSFPKRPTSHCPSGYDHGSETAAVGGSCARPHSREAGFGRFVARGAPADQESTTISPGL